jgi:hypothetical protein
MLESDIYISLASRFLKGSAAATRQAHELAGFACYHAFESAGGAYVTHYGKPYPLRHAKKLNAFVAQCKGKPRLRYNVSSLAIELQALRNLFLYPNLNGLTWMHPMTVMTPAQVDHLRSRVSGIVRIIQAEIK